MNEVEKISDRVKEVDSTLEEFWGEIDFTIYPDEEDGI